MIKILFELDGFFVNEPGDITFWSELPAIPREREGVDLEGFLDDTLLPDDLHKKAVDKAWEVELVVWKQNSAFGVYPHIYLVSEEG